MTPSSSASPALRRFSNCGTVSPQASGEEGLQEVAAYESRLASLDGRMLVLQWMVGFELALTVAILWLLVRR
jgi:hypothetical protein